MPLDDMLGDILAAMLRTFNVCGVAVRNSLTRRPVGTGLKKIEEKSKPMCRAAPNLVHAKWS